MKNAGVEKKRRGDPWLEARARLTSGSPPQYRCLHPGEASRLPWTHTHSHTAGPQAREGSRRVERQRRKIRRPSAAFPRIRQTVPGHDRLWKRRAEGRGPAAHCRQGGGLGHTPLHDRGLDAPIKRGQKGEKGARRRKRTFYKTGPNERTRLLLAASARKNGRKILFIHRGLYFLPG